MCILGEGEVSKENVYFFFRFNGMWVVGGKEKIGEGCWGRIIIRGELSVYLGRR